MTESDKFLAGEGAERRYYAVPDDRSVKVARDTWCEDVALAYCLDVVLGDVGGLVRLSMGEWSGHKVATLYTGMLYLQPHVQAVSGWGATSVQAIRELAFRWDILMGRSWLSKNHIVRAGLRGPLLARLAMAMED